MERKTVFDFSPIAVIRVRLLLRQLDQKITSRVQTVTGSVYRVNHIYLIVFHKRIDRFAISAIKSIV